MKYLLVLFFFALQFTVIAQESTPSQKFWDNLKAHCGKAYEGKLVTPESDPRFSGKLVMHVRSCEDGTLRIPFFVGEDRSRTWVLTMDDQGLIQLKHDHRHEDGSEDQVTQYGGMASNTGSETTQFFPADQFTVLVRRSWPSIWTAQPELLLPSIAWIAGKLGCSAVALGSVSLIFLSAR